MLLGVKNIRKRRGGKGGTPRDSEVRKSSCRKRWACQAHVRIALGKEPKRTGFPEKRGDEQDRNKGFLQEKGVARLIKTRLVDG